MLHKYALQVSLFLIFAVSVSPIFATSTWPARYQKAIALGQHAHSELHRSICNLTGAHLDYVHDMVLRLRQLEEQTALADEIRYAVQQTQTMLAQPQALIHSENETLVLDLINAKKLNPLHPGFRKFTHAISALEGLSSLLQENPIFEKLQKLIDYYKNFKINILKAKPTHRKELLRPELQMITEFGDFLILPSIAYQILGKDRQQLIESGTANERIVYGNGWSQKPNKSGEHIVTRLQTQTDDVHFKLEKLASPLTPYDETVVFWLSCLWHGYPTTSASTMLYIKDIEILGQDDGITKENIIIQASATANGQLIGQETSIDKSYFHQDAFAQILVLPSDRKMEHLFIGEDGKITSIDNGTLGIKASHSAPSYLIRKNKQQYWVNLRNTLFFHPQMQTPIAQGKIPQHHPVEFLITLFAYLNGSSRTLEHWGAKCQLDKKQHKFNTHELISESMKMPLQIYPWYLDHLLKMLGENQHLEKTLVGLPALAKNTTLQDVVTQRYPLVGQYYQTIAGTKKNNLFECEQQLVGDSNKGVAKIHLDHLVQLTTGDWQKLDATLAKLAEQPPLSLDDSVLHILNKWQLQDTETEEEIFQTVFALVAENFWSVGLKVSNECWHDEKILGNIIQNSTSLKAQKLASFLLYKFAEFAPIPQGIKLIEQPTGKSTDIVSLIINGGVIDQERFSTFAGFTNLKQLAITDCQLNTDDTSTHFFAPLQNLQQLTTLDLTNNNIKDIRGLTEALVQLQKINTLILKDNPIRAPEPLAKLTQLRNLNLTGTKITHLRFLEPLTKLKQAITSGTLIIDDIDKNIMQLQQKIVKFLDLKKDFISEKRAELEQYLQADSQESAHQQALNGVLSELYQPEELFMESEKQTLCTQTEPFDIENDAEFQNFKIIRQIFKTPKGNLKSHPKHQEIANILDLVITHYVKFFHTLEMAKTAQERQELLAPKITLQFANNQQRYRIPLSLVDALTSLMRTQGQCFGVINKQNTSGSHAVKPYKSFHYKTDFCPKQTLLYETEEGDNCQAFILHSKLENIFPIEPGMQDAAYLMELFFNGIQGEIDTAIVPAIYLTLCDLEIFQPRTPDEPKTYFFNLKEKEQIFSKIHQGLAEQYQQKPGDFTPTKIDIGIAVAPTIPGMRLDCFLENVQKGDSSLYELDFIHYSKLVLVSLLGTFWDFKGDNFIVTPVENKTGKRKIYAIDSDSGFDEVTKIYKEDMGIGFPDTTLHSARMRNILLILAPLMGRPIAQEALEMILAIKPAPFILRWLAVLAKRNQYYRLHGQHTHKTTEEISAWLARFTPGIIIQLHKTLRQMQSFIDTQKNPTLQDVFELCYPDIAKFYQTFLNHNLGNYTLAFKQIYQASCYDSANAKVEHNISNSTLDNGHRILSVMEKRAAGIKQEQKKAKKKEKSFYLPEDAALALVDQLDLTKMADEDVVTVIDLMAEFFWEQSLNISNKHWKRKKQKLWQMLLKETATTKAKKLVFLLRFELAPYCVAPENITLQLHNIGFYKNRLLGLKVSNTTLVAEDLKKITSFPNLQKLTLTHTDLKDTSGLQAMTCLTHLDFSHNSLKHIRQIGSATLPALTVLNLSHNQLNNQESGGVAKIAELSRLQWINLSYNNLENISFTYNLLRLSLQYIDARGNIIKETDDIQNLRNSNSQNLTFLIDHPLSQGSQNCSVQ
ncbi:MAG: hypothetical protein ABFQ95_05195 [Pseudomonadota bacterium]